MAKKGKAEKKADKKVNPSQAVQNEKACAILSYLLIGIIWYFADENMKKSEIVKFHVKQGLVLLISMLIVSVVWSIPILGWIIGPLLNLGNLILLIMGMINAANEKQVDLPVIGSFAKSFSF